MACAPRALIGRCPIFAALILLTGQALAADNTAVDFNRDIRAILSDNCYKCHGPDQAERKAGLRLDVHEGALAELESGAVAVVPGKRDESELFARITSQDASDQMPPPASGKKLTANQIELLGRWIDQGVGWNQHWSFTSPKRPEAPQVAGQSAARNDIDRFVLAKLEREGLALAAPAEKTTLIRRVTYDLTGLPPHAGRGRRFPEGRSAGRL